MSLYIARTFAKPRVSSPTGLTYQQVRHGGANLKELRNRIKSVNSIQKITASMKLVAAAKLKQAQENIEQSLPSTQTFLPLTQFTEVEADITSVKRLAVIPITADRGLCGSINSGIMRAVTKLLNTELEGATEKDFFVFGEKGRAGLARDNVHNFKIVLAGFDKRKNFPFEDLLETVDEVSKGNYDQYTIVYNHFVNLITYKIQIKNYPPKSKILEADWSEYEFEGDKNEILADLYDYYLATNLYGALIDNAASELSARMSSMENASKNAAGMIQALSIKFNKGRQAAITTELIEIISGAEAFKTDAD
eukprot:TRINITY_DN5169_c0_g1_i1.p1 TRINITY_DN5169_c0_g1~~TRINITY_DN5169_c0_g1_i1.p1  ORF type:complete len:326 (-),score=117.38 TRINITY_DN5169_c0_g1_i1:50-973(-)